MDVSVYNISYRRERCMCETVHSLSDDCRKVQKDSSHF